MSQAPAQTSSEVSKLAAKVAHELNNPLDAVLRFVSLAQRKARSGDYAGIERNLSDAQFGLERMAETLRELMDLGRQSHDSLARTLLLADLIAQATRTAAGLAEQRHVLLTVRNALPAEARGTARQGDGPRYDQRLVQILSNLVKNAIEASPEGGTVRIAIGPSSQSAGSLTITVEDSGPGIAPELLPRLFTSFVTTKEGVGGLGGGHGLGLAISRELVLALHGTLTLENRAAPATGCLATVTLPLT